jgi:heat shock protein HslJ
MRRGGLALGIVMASVFAAACTGSGTASASPAPKLDGITWTLTSYADAGTLKDVAAEVYADARFDGTKVFGSAGCNGFNGAYVASGSSLTVTGIVSTKMACPPPASTVETAYLANLAGSATYTVTTESLTIFDAGGATLLIFRAAKPGGLTGVTWHATAYNNGKQAVQSVAIGSDPTALFGTDGTASGNATCNTYNGPALITGNRLAIGPLAATKMACASDALNAQEVAYLAALEGVQTYDIRGKRLELRDAGGALMASFEQR